LAVYPATVRTGQLITVSHAQTGSGGRRLRLPQKIECSISSDDDLLQTIIFDVAGQVSLNLGDTFGALRLQGCGNRTCFEQILYTVEVRNVGRDRLVLPGAGFNLNSERPSQSW
jgi:hypothetical protein